MLTKTNNYNNYTNPMAKCVDNAETLQRDDWDARIENAQHRAFKRRHAAAMHESDTAKRAALFARLSDPSHHNWFTADIERSVTAEAPLVIECLNGQAPPHPPHAAVPAVRHPRVPRARALPPALAL